MSLMSYSVLKSSINFILIFNKIFKRSHYQKIIIYNNINPIDILREVILKLILNQSLARIHLVIFKMKIKF